MSILLVDKAYAYNMTLFFETIYYPVFSMLHA